VCLAASYRFAYLLNLASIRTRLHPFSQSVLSLVKQVAHLCRRWSSFEPSCHLLHLTQLSRVNHRTHANLQCRREELSRSVHLLLVLAKRRREDWVHSCSHRTLGSLTHFIELLLSSFIKFSRYGISHQHPLILSSDYELGILLCYILEVENLCSTQPIVWIGEHEVCAIMMVYAKAWAWEPYWLRSLSLGTQYAIDS